MMLILIDGHNLIGKLRGFSLADMDDEARLITLLQAYCRTSRNPVEVFFDKAPSGSSGKRTHGQVLAHFIRAGKTADDAIIARLKQLGKAARNCCVISSDRMVQQAARAVHARVQTSEAFGRQLQAAPTTTDEENDPTDRLLSADEVAEWEQLFRHPRQKN